MTALSVDTGTSTSYFPSLPPRAPRASSSYCRSIRDAPLTALMGVVVDGREPERHPVSRRCRVRSQVGYTNRWRLPESLGSDLLGTSQAIRAIQSVLNESMMDIISAESPQMTMHVNMEEPYVFRHERVQTSSAPSFRSSIKSAGSQDPHRAIPRPLSTCMPTTARPAKPMDLFQYHVRKASPKTSADVFLRCMDMSWELHRSFLYKSDVLTSLLTNGSNNGTQHYTEKKKISEYDKALLDSVERRYPDKSLEEKPRVNSCLVLNIKDPLVSKAALGIALGHMYHDEIDIADADLVYVLAAAKALHFQKLIHGVTQQMCKTISSHTVCAYHGAATKYGLEILQEQTERWLELNLVPKMCNEIQLRLLSQTLLLKTIQSPRLFTYNEYSTYIVLVYWLFLQLNPKLQLVPTFSSLLTYFNSLPKSSSLLERPEGSRFYNLFANLRLHGITDMSHMKDVQAMNIVPENWIVKVLSQHYHSLQAGGDMSLMNNFQTGSLRQGFLMDEEPHYHSEIFSLHGFHFELKAVRLSESQTYSFFLQRLKPSDPMLSFKQCERHTFSLRPEREVRYNITVQCQDKKNKFHHHQTGMISKHFGLGPNTSRSEVLTLENLTAPLYVNYSLLLPPS